VDIFEDAILRYVATDCSTFVIPQYDIRERGSDESWASFDFVGIHLRRKRIYVIEITSASNSKALFSKVAEMFQPEKHIGKLAQQLQRDHGKDYGSWPIHVAVFVREAERGRFEKFVAVAKLMERVHVFAIEECIFPWKYWDRIVGTDKSWDLPSVTPESRA
jgi:hypothetical protein